MLVNVHDVRDAHDVRHVHDDNDVHDLFKNSLKLYISSKSSKKWSRIFV